MVPDDDRTRRRRVRSALTDRQRHVLDLLSAGKTNGEIATDLGVSLDGAKYHVREVCDRLGVDSREEAAEWWRQEQGMRARFSVVRDRLGRMPALVRWGLAGGAALGVATIAAFAFWPQDEDRAGLDPGVWVALAVPLETEGRADWLVQLRLVNTKTGEEYDIGKPGAWYWLSLAPDGERLYALEANDEQVGTVLHLFDLGSGETVEIPWERTHGPERAVWSPDATRLSVATSDWAGVLTRDGVLHGQRYRPPPEGGTGAGICSWALDSSVYMCAAGNLAERLVVANREGELITFLEGDSIAPSPLDTLERWYFGTRFRWVNPDQIEIVATTVDEARTVWRTWRSVGELDAQAAVVRWGPTEELTETEYLATLEPSLSNERKIVDRHGVPGGQPWGEIRESWNGEFTGTFVGDSSAPGDPPPLSSEMTFVAFVDGERFAYPIGRMERPYSSYLFVSWDMVRVK